MATLNVFHETRINGTSSLQIGNRDVVQTVTFGEGEVYRATVEVEDDYAIETLWTTAQGGVTAFVAGCVISTAAGLLELRNDNGTPQYSVIQVVPNVPVWISDDMLGGTTALSASAATTIDQVDRIRFKREAAADAGDAIVDLYLFN